MGYPRPKKCLSQFFLLNKAYLKKIADFVSLEYDESILEIGPGRGELTDFLVGKGRKIDCVEIDKSLSLILKEKFSDFKNVNIYNQDIRDFKLSRPNTVVVGNLPYHISFEIIEFLIRNRDKINRAFLTLQKEFAQKLTAELGSKDYGFLTCLCGLYMEKRLLIRIPKSCFFPKPKVDSSLVEFKVYRKEKVFLKKSPDEFKVFLRKVFGYRRKKIRTILKKCYSHLDDVETLLSGCKVNPDLRPEGIDLSGLASIFNRLHV